MSIRDRLLLAVFVPVLLALAVAVALGLSYRATQVAQRNGDIVRQVRTSISDLNGFVYSYILYHDERPQEQFAAGYAAMAGLLARIRPQDRAQEQYLADVRLSGEALNNTFLKLVSSYENAAVIGDSVAVQEAETALTGQLLLRLHNADESASFLRSLVDADISRSQTRTFLLVLAVLLIATVPLTVMLVWTRQRIVSSLAALHRGTEMVGSGDLNSKIEASARDELGDLARAFNRMTANLRTVTASKQDLEREINLHKTAEEALRSRTEELEIANRELEIANRELEAFSYSVSHDLRAPLRALDGFSEMVLADYKDRLDETGRDYLARIRKASQKMSELIDSMLKLSRVSRVEMHLQEVDLSALARTICDDLRAANSSRSVEFSISPGLVAQGDRNLLNIGLTNLLENAWKYTSRCAGARVEFGLVEKDGERVYYIRDNGIGFDMQHAGKLFQPFERLHTGPDYSGTGIGLATAQRVIRRHGGRIWAESGPGRGATFYFTLA